MKHLPLIALLLAACSPQEAANTIVMRTAETVVKPIVDDNLTGVQANAATRCIVDNATVPELEALARDVGVGAGTATIANVRAVIARPATAGCLAAAAVPPIVL